MIDLRTPDGPDGAVPMDDIIGIFGVDDGAAGRETYHPNKDYRLITENGPFKLPPQLLEPVRAEVLRLVFRNPALSAPVTASLNPRH